MLIHFMIEYSKKYDFKTLIVNTVIHRNNCLLFICVVKSNLPKNYDSLKNFYAIRIFVRLINILIYV